MKVLFRVDSSHEIGTGHVVRCVALAKILKNEGYSITFYSLDLPGNLNSWIQQQGIEVVSSLSSHEFYDCCIFDHYSLNNTQESSFRRYTKIIGVIDDWGTRMHDADFIIDPSISANSTLRAQVNSNTKFFTGPKWLLLREEFEKHHAEATARKNFQKVFVFFGGTDPKKLSIPYIRAMQEMEADLSGLNLKIIVSPHQANADDILKMRLPDFIEVHYNPISIPKLMLDCDIYFGSGGTITWERMCLGLTGAVISVVENQVDIAKTLHQIGLHHYIGSSETIAPKTALKNLLELIDSRSSTLTKMSERSLSLIDGKGTQRVSNLLSELLTHN